MTFWNWIERMIKFPNCPNPLRPSYKWEECTYWWAYNLLVDQMVSVGYWSVPSPFGNCTNSVFWIISVYPQVADNTPLYGVCVFVPEIVQRAPAFFAMNTDLSPPRSPPGRFLVSAPRCYCLLTRLPYFDLHFEVLNRLRQVILPVIAHLLVFCRTLDKVVAVLQFGLPFIVHVRFFAWTEGSGLLRLQIRARLHLVETSWVYIRESHDTT